jgi:hypothetical protein
VLGVSAESLDGLEMGAGDCPTRDRRRLATETLQAILVPIVATSECRPRMVQKLDPLEKHGESSCGFKWLDSRMPAFLTPLSFIIGSIAGCLNQYQQHAIDYLIEENR